MPSYTLTGTYLYMIGTIFNDIIWYGTGMEEMKTDIKHSDIAEGSA